MTIIPTDQATPVGSLALLVVEGLQESHVDVVQDAVELGRQPTIDVAGRPQDERLVGAAGPLVELRERDAGVVPEPFAAVHPGHPDPGRG